MNVCTVTMQAKFPDFIQGDVSESRGHVVVWKFLGRIAKKLCINMCSKRLSEKAIGCESWWKIIFGNMVRVNYIDAHKR